MLHMQSHSLFISTISHNYKIIIVSDIFKRFFLLRLTAREWRPHNKAEYEKNDTKWHCPMTLSQDNFCSVV